MGALQSSGIAALRSEFAQGRISPMRALEAAYRRIEACEDPAIWIRLVPLEQAREALRVAEARSSRGPLFGIPFAVKDNIDVAGLPTTAACPSFAYVPERSAPVVERLIAAGAILVGKTNMDQFATGLVGVRSPYGAVRNAFDGRYISGGSSSGSAVAVARGHVAFSLGTDTAGSGRVPAAFNEIVGVKPTRGWLSTRGVVPACRSLDCVSIFAPCIADARAVLDVCAGFDPDDPFARCAPRFDPLPSLDALHVGIPDASELAFFGDARAERAYATAIEHLTALGARCVGVDFVPFRETADLLYQGPWVAERWAALERFFETNPPDLDPTVARIVRGGATFSAADAFRAQYRLAELRRRTEATWRDVDALLLPTAPSIYTLADVERDPLELNSRLGRYTNFVNLLDLCAVALPAGRRDDGLPFGVSLIAPAWTDHALLTVADRLARPLAPQSGAAAVASMIAPPSSSAAAMITPPSSSAAAVPVAPLSQAQPSAPTTAFPSAFDSASGRVAISVVGAHLSGQPLNSQLIERGARLLRTCRTARDYRLYALDETRPAKPGLRKAPGFLGPGLEVEVWELGTQAFGSLVALVPPPLTIGNVELDDGTWVKGFLCEPAALDGALDITHFGGWRNYLESAATETPA